jgi:hypothetical protein
MVLFEYYFIENDIREYRYSFTIDQANRAFIIFVDPTTTRKRKEKQLVL